LDQLRSLDLDERTIVIFTSDNGSLGDVPPPWGSSEPLGGSNLPLRGAKGSTWEGGMRVPAIVRWAGTLDGGRVCDQLLTSMDLYPTLAGLCGARVPADRVIDGLDVLEVWRDPTARSPHHTFAYYRGDNLEAVRDHRYKLHVARGGQEVIELYDLTEDPGETTEVGAAHPAVVERLGTASEGYRVELGDGRLGVEGRGVRPIGRVEHPSTLTTFDPEHPYFMAEYDLDDRG
jgi:arylsulfatase A-like enzyme